MNGNRSKNDTNEITGCTNYLRNRRKDESKGASERAYNHCIDRKWVNATYHFVCGGQSAL